MQRKNTKRTTKRKEPTAHASAVAVLEFLNSGKVPDFLCTVVRETIDRACEHLDPHDPFKPNFEPGHERYVLDILMAVMRRTRTLSYATWKTAGQA